MDAITKQKRYLICIPKVKPHKTELKWQIHYVGIHILDDSWISSKKGDDTIKENFTVGAFFRISDMGVEIHGDILKSHASDHFKMH
jgi:hypothetical protein